MSDQEGRAHPNAKPLRCLLAVAGKASPRPLTGAGPAPTARRSDLWALQLRYVPSPGAGGSETPRVLWRCGCFIRGHWTRVM